MGFIQFGIFLFQMNENIIVFQTLYFLKHKKTEPFFKEIRFF